MNTIWYLGDSYISPPDMHKNYTAKSWTTMVSEAFQEYDSKNLGLPAASLDHLYYTYDQNKNNFKSGDIIVIALTNYLRIFLSNEDETDDHPRFMNCNFLLDSTGTHFHQEGDKYYDFFVSEFYNEKVVKTVLNIFIKSLQYDAIDKELKIIVLPTDNYAFEDTKHLTMGITTKLLTLKAVTHMQTVKKFQDKIDLNSISNMFQLPEVREYDNTLANHLDFENNEVLANKVIEAIKTNAATIDLTTGWKNI